MLKENAYVKVLLTIIAIILGANTIRSWTVQPTTVGAASEWDNVDFAVTADGSPVFFNRDTSKVYTYKFAGDQQGPKNVIAVSGPGGQVYNWTGK